MTIPVREASPEPSVFDAAPGATEEFSVEVTPVAEDNAADLPAFEVPQFPECFALGPVARLRKAEEWRFVLRAIGIGSWISSSPDGSFFLMVPASIHERAERELGEYEAELKERRETPKPRDIPMHPSSWWAVAMMAALIGFFLLTGPLHSRSLWFQHGVADTNQILAGALEQTVTALTLHADAGHIVGNAVVGGVFLSAVHRRFGAGFGSFVVLSAGAAGNLMNAVYHGSDHRSLGASTAVMAALGVLAATQFILNRKERPRMKNLVAWAPIAGGVALLGTFGASKASDLHAHGFGFLAGLLFGAVAAWSLRNRTAPMASWVRFGFGTASALLVAGAWSIAILGPPV